MPTRCSWNCQIRSLFTQTFCKTTFQKLQSCHYYFPPHQTPIVQFSSTGTVEMAQENMGRGAHMGFGLHSFIWTKLQARAAVWTFLSLFLQSVFIKVTSFHLSLIFFPPFVPQLQHKNLHRRHVCFFLWSSTDYLEIVPLRTDVYYFHLCMRAHWW